MKEEGYIEIAERYKQALIKSCRASRYEWEKLAAEIYNRAFEKPPT